MEPRDILILLLLALFSFYLGWTLGRWKAQKQWEDRRQKRAEELVGMMFKDLHHLQDENPWTGPRENILNHLQKEMELALEREDYEKAAQIRDLIKNEEQKR